MSGADRGRLSALRDERAAALAGSEALEQKLELVRREVLRHAARCEERRTAAAQALRKAREALGDALVQTGRRAVQAAVLAQPQDAAVAVRKTSLAGVPLAALSCAPPPFLARYGPAGTSAALDAAGQAFAEALPELCGLASEEAALRALRKGQRRTARRLNALEKAVLPALERELREVAAALEEAERDESIRRRAWASLAHAR